MQGLMMDQQLLVGSILDHAARYHGDTELVSVNTNGGQTRYCYKDAHQRARKMASALEKRGLKKSERVATIAWNNHRHFELYYAISGSGLIIHTINPRLFPEQLVYVITHAKDRVVFFDQTFLPLVEALRDKVPVEAWVLMEPRNDELAKTHPWLEFYEELLATGDDGYQWPDDLDERDASGICYTSGTTGNPKGVLYSHRSTLLHAMMSATPDMMNLSSRDCLLPVVPMFHVNAWGTPYASPLSGSKMVFPGPNLDGESLTNLFNDEKVSISAGVPTIWKGLVDHLKASGASLPHLDRTIVGGSACPPSMIDTFRDDYGVEVLHAWGMTELSPLGTINTLKNKHLAFSEADQNAVRETQGRPPYGMELAIFDDNMNQLANDGEAQGDLYCRGPWVLSEYLDEGTPATTNGWFATGDVATIDEDGFMHIRDRSKDIIKSGGEWISSVELENLMLGHPDVADAAVIAAPHPKWDERPVLIVVPKPEANADEAALLSFYDGKVAKWWIPDQVKFIDEIPRNATGKVRKNVLREQFGDCLS